MDTDITSEPIVVVGYSFKFPQDADSSKSFWDMLCEGRCASTDFPPERLNVDAHYDPGSSGARMLPLRGGHFLKEDIAVFDSTFFNITPTEAKAMDPQHRIMLETSYRALENAGIPLAKCYGSSTSVYTATFTNDYQTTVAADLETLPKYAATGLSASMLANRVSWFYNFQGASMNLDSACSSSLSALHLACEDLRRNTSDMSVVGGSNLVFNPQFMLLLTNMGFLSNDSRCWSFDKRANGYARGDGVGVIILKKLTTALKDGDTIRAVIRATGLNQDGRTKGGITQPSGDAQRQLIATTFARAKIDMSTVRYFEAHGTGTALGDPIESLAIGETFRPFRSDQEPLIVGSVKSSIGHLEGASGVAGLIKTIMILETGIIPPVAGLTEVNPKIDIERLRIHFPTQPLKWPCNGLRRACVNSFGFGGSNATVILDDARHYLQDHGFQGHHRTIDIYHSGTFPQAATSIAMNISSAGPGPSCVVSLSVAKRQLALQDSRTEAPSPCFTTPHRICVWSAADESALKNMVSAYRRFIEQRKADSTLPALDDIAYTLISGRSYHSWRSYRVVSSLEEFCSDIQLASQAKRVSNDPRLAAFVFTGQGAAYAKMGFSLLGLPHFRNRILQLNNILHDVGPDLSIEELLSDCEIPINDPEYSQVVTTALQIALVDLLRYFGITPKAVIGHSSGEIAAAYCAGAISDKAAMAIAYNRGRLAATVLKQSLIPQSMLAVALTEETVQPYLKRLESEVDGLRVQIGCLNSPTSITLTGDESQLERLQSWLIEAKHFARKLRVAVAYHSTFMQMIEEEYIESLRSLDFGEKSSHPFVMISSVTGNIVPASMLRDPKYWATNLVTRVNFAPAMTFLCVQSGKPARKQLGRRTQSLSGITELIEIGPHSTLREPIRDVLNHAKTQTQLQYLAALNKSKDSAQCILELVGQLWTMGYPVDLLKASNLERVSRPVLTGLPEYSFNHSQRYWSEDRISTDLRFRKHPPHELLGTWIPSSNPLEARWRNFLSVARVTWVKDHHIGGECVLPAAGMIAMTIEAVKQLLPADAILTKCRLSGVKFLNALRVPDDDSGTEIQLSLSALTAKSTAYSRAYAFRLLSYDSEWSEHCTGTIDAELKEREAKEPDSSTEEESNANTMSSISCSCTMKGDRDVLYNATRKNGVDYGPIFQVLRDIRYDCRGQVLATMSAKSSHTVPTTNGKKAKTYEVHPSVLDGLFQLVFPALYQGGKVEFPALVPTSVESFTLYLSQGLMPSGSFLQASCKSAFDGYRGTNSDVIALSDRGKKFIAMDGYRSTFISGTVSLSNYHTTARPLLSHFQWRPDLASMNKSQIDSFCALELSSNPEPVDNNALLAILIRYYLTTELTLLRKSLAINPESQAAMRTVRISQRLAEFENGTLQHDQSIWDQVRNDPKVIGDLENGLYSSSGVARTCIDLGRHILFSKNDAKFSSSIHDLRCHLRTRSREQFDQESLSAPLKTFLSMVSHKTPTAKILHIVGATSAPIIPHADFLTVEGLPRWSRYVLAHPTAKASKRAREAFELSYKAVEFRTLDIHANVLDQGFRDHEYDLVIASHILDEPGDTTDVLKRLRQLIKPDGWFVTTRKAAGALAVDFAFDWSPSNMVTQHETETSLVKAGFSAAGATFRDPDSFYETYALNPAMPPQDASSVSISGLRIVLDRQSAAQHKLAQQVRTHFENQGVSNIVELDICYSNDIAKSSKVPCICLLEYESTFWDEIHEDKFIVIQQLLTTATQLLWIVKSADSPLHPKLHIVDGLSRVLRSENSKRRIIRLKLNIGDQNSDISTLSRVFHHLLTSPIDQMEPEYEERNGILHIGRVVPLPTMNKELNLRLAPFQTREVSLDSGLHLMAYLETSERVGNIQFRVQTSPDQTIGSDEVVIRVHAVGITVRDHLIMTGQLNDRRIFTECSGVITQVGANSTFHPGDRVIAISPYACTTSLRCKESCVVAIPSSMSFTDAAGLPMAALIASSLLARSGTLSEETTVLIHHAAGATGQLCIQVAKHVGATVLVTASNEEKRTHLRETYNIPERHVFSSKDANLSETILRTIGGHYVDIAIGFTWSDFDISSSVLNSFGQIINLDLTADSSEATRPRSKPICATTSTIDIVRMAEERPKMIRHSFRQLLPLIEQGAIKAATPTQVFGINNLEEALKWHQSRKHPGKAVVDLTLTKLVSALVPSKSSSRLDPNATYVVAGGFGGIGRSITRWMVNRGARNILILSRSGAKSDTAGAMLKELNELGARAEAPCCDITQRELLEHTLELVTSSMPPIRGCVQCTMVLRDAIFENMTHREFVETTQPKVAGSWNLHTLLPAGMDFFVMLSSITGILGSQSQANYAAGNTYEDALARYRVANGEKAVSIDLGMMVSEGVVAETEGMLDSLRRLGWFMEITQPEFLALFDYYCDPALPLLGPEECQIIVGIEHPAAIEAKGMELPDWIQRPLFRHSHLIGTARKEAVTREGKLKIDFETTLRCSADIAQAAEHVTRWFLDKLSQISGVPVPEINVGTPLHVNGINSLAAVEVLNWFDRKISADMTIFELLSNSSIADICRNAAKKSKFFQSGYK